MPQRKIELLLTEEKGRFDFSIHIDGKHACSGLNHQRAIDAYDAALLQLRYNDIGFPVDCPDPFMSEDRLDRFHAESIEKGLRAKL